MPEVRDGLVALATIIMGGPPERLDQVVRADIDKWAKVINSANLKPE